MEPVLRITKDRIPKLRDTAETILNMENGLPKGWVETTLGVVADWGSGGTPKATESKYYNGDIPWLIIGDLNDGYVKSSEKKITMLGFDNSSAKKVPIGSVLIAMYGSIGKLGIADIECTTNQAIAFTQRIHGGISNRFLFQYLFSQKKNLLDIGKGGTQANISQTVLKEYPIPLPPLSEQNRIVAKLDAVLARVNNCKARLEKVPALLKNFRQSVLNSITEVSGKELTANDVCSVIQIGPFGTQLHQHEYIENGIPVINPSHIKDGNIVPDYSLTISKKKHTELSNYHLQLNDVIMGRRGEMGRCAFIQDNRDLLCGTGSLFFRPNKKVIHPEFLFWQLRNQNTKAYLENEAKGTTMSNLNLSIVGNIPLNVPSINEQKAIVRKVEELFHYADSIEARYQKAKAWFDKLPQSILAKAFRGELVAQDENDEPANVLLERILNSRLNGSVGQAKVKSKKTEAKTAKQKPKHTPKTKTSSKTRKMYEENERVSMVAEDQKDLR